MKLIRGGKYTGEHQLPTAELPPNAVRFNEPETPAQLNIAALGYALPTLLLVVAIMALAYVGHGGLMLTFGPAALLGILAANLAVLPHELLHAVGFGKGAPVYLFFSPKHMMAFVVCTQPVSKRRFIALGLLPNLLLGWLPLLIWAALPYSGFLSDFLFWFSLLNVFMGVGDYLNVVNAIRQMPRGSMQQLSGFHSYWYMP